MPLKQQQTLLIITINNTAKMRNILRSAGNSMITASYFNIYIYIYIYIIYIYIYTHTHIIAQ